MIEVRESGVVKLSGSIDMLMSEVVGVILALDEKFDKEVKPHDQLFDFFVGVCKKCWI